MRSIATVLCKEVREGLRDRRAMITALLFGPMFGPILFAGITNYAVSIQLDEAEKPIEVPVVGGAEASNLMAHLHRRLIDVDHEAFSELETLRESVRRGDTDVGLVVDIGFGSALRDGSPARLWIVTDVSNNTARSAVSRLRSALVEYGSIIGTQRLQLRGIDPSVARPIAVLTEDVSTPSGRAILLLGMMTYFLLFATLIGGTQVAIDTTAGERERGSLEPLLTLPAARASVVWGKLGATFFFMAVSLGVSIVAFAIAVRFLPLAKVGMTANFTPEVCAVMYVVMLPFAVLGAGVMTIVASYTKSFREAQTYTGLAMVAPTLPIVLVVLNPVQATLGSMLVPSLSQHLLVTELVKGEGVQALHILVSAAATIAVGVLCGLATVRRYGSERLLV